jgi:OPA family glycerol-3-phosphate transporter-like MFS transporter
MATSGLRLIGSNRKYERWRWQVFSITWLAYLGFYLTRKSFSVAKVELVKPTVMGWSKADLAWVDAAFLITYAAGNFLCGVLGDRFGTRKVILTGMLASIVTAILMGASSTVILFGILFAIQGLCQSTGWAPLAKNIGEFFSQRERGRVMGFWCTSYAIGGLLGSALAGFMAQSYGWRYAFWAPAAALFGVWLLFLLFQRNRPEDVGLPPIEEYHEEPDAVVVAEETPAEEREGSWTLIRAVLKSRMVLLLALVYFLVKTPRYMFLFWSPVYVHERLGSGAAASGILGSMYDIASPIAVLLGGYCSDRLFHSKRIPMSVIGLAGTVILMLFFSHLPATPLALGLGIFGIGCLLNIPDSLVSGTAAIDFGTKKGASTASGLINGSGSMGAIIGGTAPGWIEKLVGHGHDTWHIIFLGLSAALALAAVLLLPKWNALPPTAPEKRTQETDPDPTLASRP